MDISSPTHNHPKRVSFEFSSPESIRKLSVKEITSPNLFDALNHPEANGLYDAALGPVDKNSKCSTCGLASFHCPGHFGHIELAVPVYNPLTFSQLFQILRQSCLHCHRLRGSRVRVALTIGKLRLLQAGLLVEALELENWITNRLFLAPSDGVEGMVEEEPKLLDHAALVDKLERHVRKLLHNRKSDAEPIKLGALEEARKATIDEFLKKTLTSSQCQACKAYAQGLHRHANTKIFLNPLRKNLQALNEAKGQKEVDALDAEEERAITPTEEAALKYLTPMHVYEHLKAIWNAEREVLELLFGSNKKENSVDFRMFFAEVIAVPPCRFRPPSVFNDSQFDHPQNTYLTEILKANQRIIDLNASQTEKVEDAEKDERHFGQLVQSWVTLQEQVNFLFDSSRNAQPGGKPAPSGIKQILEKKEGLFRKHMMGKRVNYAARSVISPDASIETSEIGVPMVFATKLTYPEPVTAYNREAMAQAVRNGPNIHPGASHIHYADGTVSNLEAVGAQGRDNLARELGDLSQGKKVMRHIRTGDVVLMNRQPTLHKPSMMAHKVRVLPGEKTLRMHYANCNTYNADFDGDEMNMHFPQNELARSELYNIVNTNRQYLGVTDGSPLRGLIQDHISMGVLLSCKDTFFRKSEFQQLLFAALADVPGKIEFGEPALFYPEPLYTGKQLVSILLCNLTRGRPALNLTCNCRVSPKLWKGHEEESQVIVKDGYLCTGTLDKTQFGASAFGITHAVFELYGPDTAGKLLTCIGRLLTRYSMHAAFTCRMDDLLLQGFADEKRKDIIAGVPRVGRQAVAEMVSLQADDRMGMRRALERIVRSEEQSRALDGVMKGKMNEVTSKVIEACLPEGQLRAFPQNNMALMTQTGAKGSMVNFSQISGLLGQQELEGRRVPTMVSGKTLPSFPAWDPRPRAGGYITQRFLTGIRPQEFFFHCMAGREGLIDTAVKTSRSGYLQRCLIKHLESCQVHYDSTVRQADGTVVQFLYGEDGLDVTKQKYLKNLKFAADNFDSIVANCRPDLVLDRIDTEEARKASKKAAKHPEKYDPVTSRYPMSAHLSAVSEKYYTALEKFCEDESSKKGAAPLDEKQLKALLWLRYMRSLVEPGESVGLLAAQSVGEPSTQMTLNTFHFAGFGAKNVTLGIPRLREIIMTAAQKIKTPTMTIPLNQPDNPTGLIEKMCEKLSKHCLADYVQDVRVTDLLVSKGPLAAAASSRRARVYRLEIELKPEHAEIKHDLRGVIENAFVAKLMFLIEKSQSKKRGSRATAASLDEMITATSEKRAQKVSVVGEEDDVQGPESSSRKAFKDDSDGEDDGGELDASEAKALQRKKQLSSYDDDEEEEAGDGESEEEEGAPAAAASEVMLMADKFSRMAEYRNIRNFSISDHGLIRMDLVYPASAPKLHMLDLVDQVIDQVVIRQIPGITRVQYDPSSNALLSEGVNFKGIWEAAAGTALLNLHAVTTNDVYAMLNTYGVEAARATIVSEIAGVFAVYGISVDGRHLSLIADYMTMYGGYLAFNRTGMEKAPSPLLKMSYESTVSFLRTACLMGEWDGMQSPASRIVMGVPVKCGTGSFEILHQH